MPYQPTELNRIHWGRQYWARIQVRELINEIRRQGTYAGNGLRGGYSELFARKWMAYRCEMMQFDKAGV